MYLYEYDIHFFGMRRNLVDRQNDLFHQNNWILVYFSQGHDIVYRKLDEIFQQLGKHLDEDIIPQCPHHEVDVVKENKRSRKTTSKTIRFSVNTS